MDIDNDEEDERKKIIAEENRGKLQIQQTNLNNATSFHVEQRPKGKMREKDRR